MSSFGKRSAESSRSLSRFAVVGLINTLSTTAIFVFLSLFLESWIAYSASYLTGLIASSIATSSWVFKGAFVIKKLLSFAVAHTLIYSAGRAILFLANPKSNLELLLTWLVLICVTTPMSFVAGRWIFSTSRKNKEH